MEAMHDSRNSLRRCGLPLLAICAMGVSAMPLAAQAVPDPLIEGARLCTQYFPVEEQRKNIPTHLLAAIATTESGRYHKGLGMSVPWPWTINVEGKGYYFGSKAEAIAQVQNLQSRGYQSIDVGCMQVNLKHHPRAFQNLEQAFDPAANVAYAATFLRDNYATLGDWIKATAAYHSRTPVYGQRYLVDIERSWNTIVAKVAQARATAGSDVAVAGPAPAPSSPLAGRDKPVVIASAPVAVKPAVVTTSPAMAAPRKARVISVRDSAPTRRSGEVLIVRATPSQPPLTVASNYQPASDTLPVASTVPAGDSIRRVSLDNGASKGVAVAPAGGPKFVFAN